MSGWAELVAQYGGSGLLASGVGAEGVAKRCGGRAVYLATPYSRVVLDVRGNWCISRSIVAQERAAIAARDLALRGIPALSPILISSEMCHVETLAYPEHERRLDPLDAEFWTRWCAPLLAVCEVIYVPAIRGWRESAGILHEARTMLTKNGQVLVEAEWVP